VKVVSSFGEVRESTGGTVGLVPTMGFLHEGHVSLIDAARRESDVVVMSLFVNPLQFDETGDLDRYPRDVDRDVAIAGSAGVDIVFAPSLAEMYRRWPPETVVSVPPLSDVLEGAHRPGHFDGVATAVAKLFAGVRPDLAYFGRKDAQQVAVVTAMARDLSLPVAIRPMPIVREVDGLALSSRNVFLSADDRRAALSLSRGLLTAADAVVRGVIDANELCDLVRDSVAAEPDVHLEYVELATQSGLDVVDAVDAPSFLSLAARVGVVRLIDNVHIDGERGHWRPDTGVRLEAKSMLYGSSPVPGGEATF
jgi:pantoate--beta-alanine ligase